MNELYLNPDSCKQIYFIPLWPQQKRNEFDPDCNSTRIDVNTPKTDYDLFHRYLILAGMTERE